MSLREASSELLALAASHENFLVPLPRLQVPCSVVSAAGHHEEDDAFALGERFVGDPAGNLLVVLGESGSGKSELLRRLAAKVHDSQDAFPLLIDYAELATHLGDGLGSEAVSKRLEAFSSSAAEEFDELLQRDPSQVLLLIDAFDEVNISRSVEGSRPTPQVLSFFLDKGVKLIVATRRSLTANPGALVSEFAAQLQPQSFQITYQILELQPCEVDEVDKAIAKLSEADEAMMRDYLVDGSHIHMSRVRRPLFLQMLVDLRNHPLATDRTFSIYELYDRYADVTLDRDIKPKKKSLIPREAKRRILHNIASDMFDAQVRITEARLSPDDVKQWVVEEVAHDSNRSWAEGPSGDDHDWHADFESSNHLLVKQSGTLAKAEPAVVFFHRSMFEFFLTQHFAAEFRREGMFGLKDDSHSVSAFDSLLPYFLRSQFGVGHERELTNLVTNKSTSNLDRLLGFFFLEDSPHILELLGKVKQDYTPFLQEASPQFDSFFMQKVVRYQLTLLDTGIGQALAYVSDARVREVDKDQDIEVHTFAAGQGPTEFLLKRLHTKTLANALPITIYRLGQFGDERAVRPLLQLRADVPDPADPCLLSLIDEAVEKIRGRSGAADEERTTRDG